MRLEAVGGGGGDRYEEGEAHTLVAIAKVSRAAGQSAQAKSMMAYALRTIRTTLGDNHPDVAAVLNSMSNLCIEIATASGQKEQKVLMKEALQCACGSCPCQAPAHPHTRRHRALGLVDG